MRYVDSLNYALQSLLSEPDDTVIMGEDIIDPYGGAFKVTKGLSLNFSQRVFPMPISEAGFTGVAVGMAMRGVRVIVEIMFADFLGLAFDQILNHMTKYPLMYDKRVSYSIIIRTPAGGRKGYGPTHSQNPESFFAGIPNLQIMMPSELHDPGESLKDSAGLVKPVLFIEGKELYPKQLLGKGDFAGTDWHYGVLTTPRNIGTTIRLTNSGASAADVTVISFGSTFELIRQTAEDLLMEDEICLDIFMLENISSIDYSMFRQSISVTGKVLVLEESISEFGIGAEISSKIHENFFNILHKPVVRIGALNTIIPAARQLEEIVLPSSEKLTRAIRGLAG